jgi:hypothetical protein
MRRERKSHLAPSQPFESIRPQFSPSAFTSGQAHHRRNESHTIGPEEVSLIVDSNSGIFLTGTNRSIQPTYPAAFMRRGLK